MGLKQVFIQLFCFYVVSGFGQSKLSIGQWKDHLPFKKSRHVTQSPDNVYFATEWGLIRINKTDDQTSFITKIDGLNDVSVNQVEYNSAMNFLFLTYDNSNIDIITPDEIINFSDIRDNVNIIGDKTIFEVTMVNQFAYLSCAFGIIKFDLERLEFVFTAFTKDPVYSLKFINGYFYAATAKGIFRAPEDILNIADFSTWEKLTSDFNLPTTYFASALEVYQGSLYAVVNQKLYIQSDQIFNEFYSLSNYIFSYLSGKGKFLIVGMRCLTGCGSKVIRIDELGLITEFANSCVHLPNYAVQADGDIWFADSGDEYRVAKAGNLACEQRVFNTPFSRNVSEIHISNNRVYVASGGVTQAFSYQFRRDGLFTYIEDHWDFVNIFNNQTFNENQFWDIFTVREHPINEKVYIGSYFEGLAEMENGEVNIIYDQDNSSIQGTVGDEARERISGLEFDRDNNLWIANFLAPNPISVLDEAGNWQNFSVPTSTTLTQIAIDRNNYKWFVVQGNSAGLLVLDHGVDLFDTSDDRYRVLTANNSELPTNQVNCVEADLEGEIWVGTAEGVVIFQCGSTIFEGDCPGFRKKIRQNGNIAYLLQTEDVRTIAIDGANQKWFGTQNGIFVQSPEGDTLIMSFNADKDPLLDNRIIDIAINKNNGEVFIGTAKGIQAYRSNTLHGKPFHGNDVYAFPNPVRPEYHGPIAIRGLARNADVRITDMQGQLVYQTIALGGQAIWDGKDVNGNRVASGVYLVFSTSSELFTNPEGYVTKILVMKNGF